MLSDQQVQDLAAYLRTRFTDKPAWSERPRRRCGGAQMIKLTVNGRAHQVDVDPDTPLLYVLRNDLELNAAKFGCGLGQCGACTVLLDDKPVFSCLVPVAALGERKVRTLEGLAQDPAGRVRGRAGGPMRLLHRRHDRARAGAARAQSAPDRGRGAQPHGAQPLPLRHPHAHPARGAPRRRRRWAAACGMWRSRNEGARPRRAPSSPTRWS